MRCGHIYGDYKNKLNIDRSTKHFLKYIENRGTKLKCTENETFKAINVEDVANFIFYIINFNLPGEFNVLNPQILKTRKVDVYKNIEIIESNDSVIDVQIDNFLNTGFECQFNDYL